jgi:hypothetical protein
MPRVNCAFSAYQIAEGLLGLLSSGRTTSPAIGVACESLSAAEADFGDHCVPV